MTRAVMLGCGLALASGPPARVATVDRTMAFEKNLGQVGGPTRYLARGPGYAALVSPTEMVLSLGKGRESTGLRVELVGGRRGSEVEGLEERLGKANYFIGSDPSRWRTDVPTFAR